MVIDGHAHAFPRMGAGAGFASADEHRRYLQLNLSTHPQGGRLARNNEVVDASMLRGPKNDIASLPDVNFRVGDFGRLEWDKDGETCFLQFLPPHLEDTTARPERMLAQMQYLGVEKALLQSGKLYGITDPYLSDIVRRWPSKFRACTQVQEWRADQPDQLDALRSAVQKLGLSALYYSNDGIATGGYTHFFDDPKFNGFWELVDFLRIPVLWDIRFSVRRTHADYMGEAVRLQKHMRRWPRIQNVLTHGMPTGAFDASGAIPDELWSVLAEPNLTVELLFPILYGASWEYPYLESQPVIRDLYNRLGAGSLLWGSDMPNIERSCTYRQSLDYVRKHCDFIAAADMDQIVGGNAARLYFPATA